ncbi:hypothetical protein Bpfe_022196 [Biomphalaria pfeifferi]|uniref:Uncharacterized protein n=1 Tax=Biomphalaria pfeifferi TaxID=112525 RepID=A0AAD8F377_BIOPF|nr:hypothetical protein Bpfe_022196 [Biomphalaria pfeifferi]
MHRTRTNLSQNFIWTTHAPQKTPPLAHLHMDNTCTIPDPTTLTLYMYNTSTATDATTSTSAYGQHMHRTRTNLSQNFIWTTHAPQKTPPLAHLYMDNTYTIPDPTTRTLYIYNTSTATDPTTSTPAYGQHMHRTRTNLSQNFIWTTHAPQKTPPLAHFLCTKHKHRARPNHSYTCIWTTHATY